MAPDEWEAQRWRRALEAKAKEMKCPMCDSKYLKVEPDKVGLGMYGDYRRAEVRCLDCAYIMLFHV